MTNNKIPNQTKTMSDATKDHTEDLLDLNQLPLSHTEEPENRNGNENTIMSFSSSSSTSLSPIQPLPSQNSPRDACFLGFIIANVVNLQYYNGTIDGREIVELVRDPLNIYYQNAIRVLKTCSSQVGNIEQAAARFLSPMMDAQLINIQGIIPKVPPKPNRHRIACQVHIFAKVEAFEAVKSAISEGGFQLLSENSASHALSQASVMRRRRDGKDETSVDDIFKLLDEQSRVCDKLEPPRDVVKSELLPHQKEGLGWLVHRENPSTLPTFWELKDGAYFNVLTNHLTNEMPEPQLGGIFADDMGLGKTLTLLSLITFDKYGGDSHATVPHKKQKTEDVGMHARGKSLCDLDASDNVCTGTESKGKSVCPSDATDDVCSRINSRKVSKSDSNPSEYICSRTTLVVCPPSVFSSWETQIGEHIVAGKLKVYMYYGDRTKDANMVCEHDIVLTTYNTLSSEDSWNDSPMKKIEWRRIILDEAHLIKNVNARLSVAVTKLNSKRRWVVTGTPIQNNSSDLFSLLAFLRFEPLSIKSHWNNLIAKPIASGDEKGISWLQVLMAAICLRRMKENVLTDLPSKTVETLLIDLSGEERDVYDKMEAEAQKLISHYLSGENLVQKYSSVLTILVRLRQICNSLSLCPPNIREFLPSLEDVNNNPKLLEKMLSMLQESDDLDCPICMSPPTNPVITSCAHIFCQGCILKAIRRATTGCPMCRYPLADSDLFSSPPKHSEMDNAVDSSSSYSSKVSVLLKHLCEVREQRPTTKSVIFSQFQKMLLLLEEPLKGIGFKILRLDGSMSAKKRANTIKEFEVPAPDGATILLATLKSSSAGINLTVASRVYLLEPWWNPAVEEQAMDRVHRIGQRKDVVVVRIIARNTIEERILELQEKKKMLARKAFDRSGTQDRRDISREDLITLMHL